MIIRISLDELKWNIKNLGSRIDQDIVPVLKATSCDMKLASELSGYKSDIDMVAGTNISNLETIREHLDTKVMALRPPSKFEIPQSRNVDIFSMSDMDAIEMMNNYCKANGYKQGIYLMADIGENREGVPLKDLDEYVSNIRELNNVTLEALAANPGCNTGVVNIDKVEHLCDIADELGVGRVSGGSTALLAEDIPDRVDEIRIGEGVLTGRHAVEAGPILGLTNPFTLEASVIKDRGTLSLYDFGTETTNPDSLYQGPEIIGSWSDMSLVEDPGASFGNTQQWKVGYWGVVRAYDAPDVSIIYDENTV